MLNAIEYSPLHGISRLEDESVPIKPLDNFVSEPQRIVFIDEEKAQNRLLMLSPKYCLWKPGDQFRVFSGLDISKVPESLRPFIEKLPTRIRERHGKFQNCQRCVFRIIKSR